MEEDQFDFEGRPHGAADDEEEEEDEWKAFGQSSQAGGELEKDGWGSELQWGEETDTDVTAADSGWVNDGGWDNDNNDENSKWDIEENIGDKDDDNWAAFGSPAVLLERSAELESENTDHDEDHAGGEGFGWASFSGTKNQSQVIYYFS